MSSASMNASAGGSGASAGVMVGGAMMLPTQTLVENAAGASTLTTLVSAVQAAELAVAAGARQVLATHVAPGTDPEGRRVEVEEALRAAGSTAPVRAAAAHQTPG
jgi:hypothetical protein